MIREWTLSSFKSVGAQQKLALAPLTIFAGPNSSGKSTVLHSMLMISQTLASRMTARHLVLNGELVRLGEWDDVCHSSPAPGSTISVGFTLATPSEGRRVARLSGIRRVVDVDWAKRVRGVTVNAVFSIGLDSDRGTPEPVEAKLQELAISVEPRPEQPTLLQSERPELRLRWTQEVDSMVTAHRIEVPAWAETALHYVPQLLAADAHEDLASTARPEPSRFVGTNLDHFLPRLIVTSVDERYDYVNAVEAAVLAFRPSSPRPRGYWHRGPVELPDDLLSDVSRAVADCIGTLDAAEIRDAQALRTALRRAERIASENALTALHEQIQGLVQQWRIRYEHNNPARYRLQLAEQPPPFDNATEWVREVLAETVRYLGPLRDDPKPVYALPPSGDPTEVGLKGEFTAAVLDTYKNRPVAYCRPGSSEQEKVPLVQAVTAWLRHFGLLESVTTRAAGKLGHQIFVRTHGGPLQQDLTNVGVGVSQVLPVLVMSLLADEDSVLIFEQPEIHLHPRVQSLLADFFLSLVAVGKQCIVETHSEYIVNRLRLRMAEDTANALADSLSIYFVEKPGSESLFRRVQINEFGAIPEWPAGFFDEGASEADRIMHASLLRRREGDAKP